MLSTPEGLGMADSSVPLSAKRNRSGICAIPLVHEPHDGCAGRKRAAIIKRPMDPEIAAALADVWKTYGGGRYLKADHGMLGILSPHEIRMYGLDCDDYEKLDFKQRDKFISFFTILKRTNGIVLEYAEQRLLPLTLRQIFYQIVVRYKDFSNTKTNYDHMCTDLVDARLAGLLPWNAVDDPSRDLHERGDDQSVAEALRFAASTHHLNHWKNQEFAPVVLVEKDAALALIARACAVYSVPYLSCKGYGSVTSLRNKVADYCLRAIDRGQEPVVIHLSDHDATGWDMKRNLSEYMDLLVRRKVLVRHIALTLDQVAEGYGDGNPLPSDPVKTSDSREPKYSAMLAERGIGSGTWEMDALPPDTLHRIIIDEIELYRDTEKWKEVEDEEASQKMALTQMAEDYIDRLPTPDLMKGLRAVRDLLEEAAD
jgi:hypothetical protein